MPQERYRLLRQTLEEHREFHEQMTEIQVVINDLKDSDIKGEVGWEPDNLFTARIGDSDRGWVAKWEASDLAGVCNWLIMRSIMEYPKSDFAEKYRTEPAPKLPVQATRRNRRGE